MSIGIIITLINLMTLILVVKRIKKGTMKFTAKKVVFRLLVTFLIINVINFVLM